MGNADGRPATLVLLRVALNVQPAAAAAAGGLVGSKLNVISLFGFDHTGRGVGGLRFYGTFFCVMGGVLVRVPLMFIVAVKSIVKLSISPMPCLFPSFLLLLPPPPRLST